MCKNSALFCLLALAGALVSLMIAAPPCSCRLRIRGMSPSCSDTACSNKGCECRKENDLSGRYALQWRWVGIPRPRSARSITVVRGSPIMPQMERSCPQVHPTTKNVLLSFVTEQVLRARRYHRRRKILLIRWLGKKCSELLTWCAKFRLGST